MGRFLAAPLPVALVGQRHADLAVGAVFHGDDDERVAAVGGLGDEHQDPDHQHAEEDAAHAERPLVAVELDDLARDQGAAADAREQKQVPDGDAGRALVHEVDIRDGALDEDLVGGHADARDDTAGEERVVIGHACAPDAGGEHDENGQDVHGPASDDLGQRVRHEEAQADGQDQPGGRLRQNLDRDVQVL